MQEQPAGPPPQERDRGLEPSPARGSHKDRSGPEGRAEPGHSCCRWGMRSRFHGKAPEMLPQPLVMDPGGEPARLREGCGWSTERAKLCSPGTSPENGLQSRATLKRALPRRVSAKQEDAFPNPPVPLPSSLGAAAGHKSGYFHGGVTLQKHPLGLWPLQHPEVAARPLPATQPLSGETARGWGRIPGKTTDSWVRGCRQTNRSGDCSFS